MGVGRLGRARAIVLACGCALTASCAVPSTPRADVLPHRQARALEVDRVPAELRRLFGFDRPLAEDEPGWLSVGHELLYRMVLHSGRSEREWLVHMRLAETTGPTTEFKGAFGPRIEFDGGMTLLPVDVSVHDLKTGEVHASRLDLPRAAMIRSLYQGSSIAAELYASRRSPETLSQDEVGELVMGLGVVVMLFDSWQEDETLGGVLRDVVGVPVRALLGAALGGSVELRVTLTDPVGSEVTVDLPEPLGAVPARSVPVAVFLGESALLHVDLVASRTDAPLNIGAGILQIRGAHPSNENRWVQVELIGGRLASTAGK